VNEAVKWIAASATFEISCRKRVRRRRLFQEEKRRKVDIELSDEFEYMSRDGNWWETGRRRRNRVQTRTNGPEEMGKVRMNSDGSDGVKTVKCD
jgi:hypothetical protein